MIFSDLKSWFRVHRFKPRPGRKVARAGETSSQTHLPTTSGTEYCRQVLARHLMTLAPGNGQAEISLR